VRRRAGGEASESEIHVAPRILSSAEKRELILAHAAARRPADPIQRVSLWAGVFVCLTFIVCAWVYTVGSGIQKSLAGPVDPNLQQVKDLTGAFAETAVTEGANELKQGFEDIATRLDQLSAEQALLNQMAAELNASSSTSKTTPSDNLFKPQLQPSSSTVTTTP
jgi:hypothetical protein